MNEQFPKFLHHASKRARLVHSAAEQKALEPNWAESPAAHGIVTHPSLDQIEEMEDLVEEETDLSAMTKAQLIVFARRQEIVINAGLKKNELFRAIEEAIATRGESNS